MWAFLTKLVAALPSIFTALGRIFDVIRTRDAKRAGQLEAENAQLSEALATEKRASEIRDNKPESVHGTIDRL